MSRSISCGREMCQLGIVGLYRKVWRGVGRCVKYVSRSRESCVEKYDVCDRSWSCRSCRSCRHGGVRRFVWRRMVCGSTGREMYQVGMLGKGHLFEEVWRIRKGVC